MQSSLKIPSYIKHTATCTLQNTDIWHFFHSQWPMTTSLHHHVYESVICDARIASRNVLQKVSACRLVQELFSRLVQSIIRWLYCFDHTYSLSSSWPDNKSTIQINGTKCSQSNNVSASHHFINSPFTLSCSRCFTKHRAPAVDPDSNSRLTSQQQKTIDV